MYGTFPISVQRWSAETAKPSLFSEECEPGEGPAAHSVVAIWQQPVCTEDKSLLLAAWEVRFGFWTMQFKWIVCRELALGINIAAPTFTSCHLEREATSSLPS